MELVSAMCHVFQGCCLELIHDVCSVSRVSGVLSGISTCRCVQCVTYHMGVVMYQYMSMRAVCYVSEGRSFELVHVDACSVSRITWVLSCFSTCRCVQCVTYHMAVVMYQYMSMRAVCHVSHGCCHVSVHVDACSVSRITWVLPCISTCRCLQCVVYVFHGCCITRSKHLNA